MSPTVKLVLAAVLSAVVNALVAFLAPAIQPAAIALAGVLLGALGIKRPQDVSPAMVEAHVDSLPFVFVDPETGKATLPDLKASK